MHSFKKKLEATGSVSPQINSSSISHPLNENAWFVSPFTVTFDLAQTYDGTSWNIELDPTTLGHIWAMIAATYGSDASGNVNSAILPYQDPQNYYFETNLPAGSKAYFKGNALTTNDVTYRLSYYSIPSDLTSIYSTVWDSNSVDTWYPVSGNPTTGLRYGIKMV